GADLRHRARRDPVKRDTGVIARGKSLPVNQQKAAVLAATKKGLPVGWETLLTGISRGTTVSKYGANQTIFMQGQPADALYFLLQGKVKLTVASNEGKEAIVATLGPGEFFGEGCLAGQSSRMGTAVSVGDCTLAKVQKGMMARMLHEEQGLAEIFITHLLSRIVRYEADLVDQIFNSSEKRLARMLLLLSHFGRESSTETVVAGISQEHLAQMVGTTRSRINLFMNKFRKLGFVDYNNEAGLTVHRGLLSVLHD
ncbi:MAG: Crp/Fnr family transcriptional regulator, partial [Burkholderiales bacterium]